MLHATLNALADADGLLFERELRADAVRRQVAVVRALADEVQRHLLRTASHELRDQLDHELARLREAANR